MAFVKQAAIGAGLSVLGAGLVELLLAAGLQPYAPVGWPGLGTIAASAAAGVAGFAGGALVLCAYYAYNLLYPERFADFFSGYFSSIAWGIAVSLLSWAAISLRARLLQARAVGEALQASEERMRRSEQMLRLMSDNVPALMAYIDADQRYRFNNRVYETWLGASAAQLTGRTVQEVWGEERYRAMRPNLERAISGERVTYEYTAPASGGERHVLASYVPDLDEAGKPRGVFVLGSDVTSLAAAHAQLRAASERLEAALDGSKVALWDADLRSGKVYLSEAWADIVGAPRSESVVTFDELFALLHPDDVEQVRRGSVEALKGLRPAYAVEHRVRAASGEWRWVVSRGRVTERDPGSGRALRMIGTNFDITDRKRMEEALQSVAQSDVLTGLANRALLGDRLEHAVARARRSGQRVALLYLDIDRFKEINDSFGHAAGDALLKEFAVRLRACVRAADTVARIGGDEFVVLLDEVGDQRIATQVAEKVLATVRAAIQADGREVRITTSIGVGLSAEGTTADGLLRAADVALYEAKAAGRDRLAVSASDSPPRLAGS